MSNQDIEAAWNYHEATKLAYINLRTKPPLYKSYPSLPVVDLPSDLPPIDVPASEAVAMGGSGPRAGEGATSTALDLTALAQILFFSAGLVHKLVLPVAGEVHYRAASSAGALYPIEVYLVCRDLPGLDAGVYHFSPADFTLAQLRAGDFRAELTAAAGENQDVGSAPATLVFTANFWRSAWKYRARGYRYCFWDCGTILANLLAVCSGLGLPAQVVAGFVDQRVDRLVGIQSDEEASVCLVAIGAGSQAQPPPPSGRITPQVIPSTGGGSEKIAYPEADRLHTASCLVSGTEVTAWRQQGGAPDAFRKSQAPPGGSARSPHPFTGEIGGEIGTGEIPLDQVIRSRGSTRRFARQAISRTQLERVLHSSTAGVPWDFLGTPGASLVDTYLIVNAVDGVPSGAYYLNRATRGLDLLREGAFRQEAGHLCFEQALGADASAIAYFMADLGKILPLYGNRGYRTAQLEAGVVGGNMYLCAHSLGLGATGMTFYDDEVTEFFSPHAAGKSLMFLVALGVTAELNRVRPFRSRIGVLLDSLARGAGSPMPTNQE